MKRYKKCQWHINSNSNYCILGTKLTLTFLTLDFKTNANLNFADSWFLKQMANFNFTDSWFYENWLSWTSLTLFIYKTFNSNSRVQLFYLRRIAMTAMMMSLLPIQSCNILHLMPPLIQTCWRTIETSRIGSFLLWGMAPHWIRWRFISIKVSSMGWRSSTLSWRHIAILSSLEGGGWVSQR